MGIDKEVIINKDTEALARNGCLILNAIRDRGRRDKDVAIWIERKNFDVIRKLMDELDEEAFQEFKAKTVAKPWLEPNDHGEQPGDICCKRACGEFCYEHDTRNYFEKK